MESFDLSDEIKREFFKAVAVSVLLDVCTPWTLTKRLEKKLDVNNKRMPLAFEQIFEAELYKTAIVGLLASHLRNHPIKTNKSCWALLEK